MAPQARTALRSGGVTRTHTQDDKGDSVLYKVFKNDRSVDQNDNSPRQGPRVER